MERRKLAWRRITIALPLPNSLILFLYFFSSSFSSILFRFPLFFFFFSFSFVCFTRRQTMLPELCAQDAGAATQLLDRLLLVTERSGYNKALCCEGAIVGRVLGLLTHWRDCPAVQLDGLVSLLIRLGRCAAQESIIKPTKTDGK
jgi:hypothetical protein